MKKMLYGLLLPTVLGASPAQATQPRTTFYVVALTGAALHAQPSFTSKLLCRLPLGGGVRAQQTIASHEGQRIGAGLVLPGEWIKVTTPAYTGYVFSADLTTRRPVLKKSRSGLVYIDLLGPKTAVPGQNSPWRLPRESAPVARRPRRLRSMPMARTLGRPQMAALRMRMRSGT